MKKSSLELQTYISSYFGINQAQSLEKVSDLFEKVELRKGDFFLRENQHCNTLCFIKNGLLRIYALKDDREVTQWISTKGYFVTDISFFKLEGKSRWNIQALVNTDIYLITKRKYKMIETIEPKWFEFEKMFIVKCFEILENRVYSHLSMSAEERYNAYFKMNQEVFNQVPLQYIASLLGMSPETLSRIRRKQLEV
ncbi:Crp/Fnr family transcriptional regulator [Bernardetia sp.]|uniref:Crp/Fnr family transcriptional regulator n=1 Tax=Bernardetia sp. TaxID=1937974 RepID=UPI0025B8AA27|nr:cyclic nucleotide-binding domain-containing protein [Bernardetia sp.]